MNAPALMLILLNFGGIVLTPVVFFKRGEFNLRWWATALPHGLCPITLIVVYLANMEPITPRTWTVPLELVAVGLSVCSIALLFLTLGTHRVPVALWHQRHDRPQRIVTIGAYTRIRHPFYTSYMLACAGAVALFPHGFTLGIFGYLLVTLNLTARGEERRLSSSEFGEEYRRYMNRTGRFVPSWKGAAN